MTRNDAPTKWQRIALALMVAVFAILLFGRTMDGGLNHDEHQFLAPGALLAREGLLPYRDYPIFHVPQLTFAYAAIARITDHYILGAKTFSVLCSVAVIAMIAMVALQTAPPGSSRLIFPAALLVLIFFDPLFDHSSGKTWNHDAPALCTTIGLIVTVANCRRGSLLLAVVAGVVTGIAAGTRLTALPLAMPMTLAPLAFPLPWKHRVTLAVGVGIGVVIGLAPTLWLCALAPEQFYFGNFQFPHLRLLDPTDTRGQKTMSWWRKGRFFIKEVIVPSWPLFLAFAVFGLRSVRQWMRDRTTAHFPGALIVAVIPFVLLGAFAPSRYQYQHYYAFVPLLALGIAYGVNASPWTMGVSRPTALVLLALATMVMNIAGTGRNGFGWVAEIAQPARWFPMRAHATAQKMRGHLPEGEVLTLAPAWPLEAGLRIYPEFASGPFGWRSARHLRPEQRRALDMIAPDDLPQFLDASPPDGILLGFESDELEKPFLRFATERGYQCVDLGKERQLWIKPGPRALQAR